MALWELHYISPTTDHHVDIFLWGQIVRVDPGGGERVGGIKLDAAGTVGSQQLHQHGEAVTRGRAVPAANAGMFLQCKYKLLY